MEQQIKEIDHPQGKEHAQRAAGSRRKTGRQQYGTGAIWYRRPHLEIARLDSANQPRISAPTRKCRSANLSVRRNQEYRYGPVHRRLAASKWSVSAISITDASTNAPAKNIWPVTPDRLNTGRRQCRKRGGHQIIRASAYWMPRPCALSNPSAAAAMPLS